MIHLVLLGADGKPIGEPAYKPETYKRKTDSENKLKPILEVLTKIETFVCSETDDVVAKANELEQLYKQLKDVTTKGSSGNNKQDTSKED